MSKKKFDIGVKSVKYEKSDGLSQSTLEFKIFGKDVNVKMVNAIRRVAMKNLPAYGFPSELITINANTCTAFHNDYMRGRLSRLPVPKIDPKIFFLAEKYWYKVNYADNTREKHPNEQSIEAYLNYYNDTDEIVSVTTNHLTTYVEGEETPNLYNPKYPIVLIELNPKEKFQCHMKATLGVAENKSSWIGVRNIYYDELEDEKDTYLMTVEGNWQYTEQEAIIRSCQFIIYRLNEFKKDFQEKIDKKEILPEKNIHLYLEKESHTFGELLNYEFQSNKDEIASSGITQPDRLVKTILIKIESKDDSSPFKAMLKCVDVLISKFEYMEKVFEKAFK